MGEASLAGAGRSPPKFGWGMGMLTLLYGIKQVQVYAQGILAWHQYLELTLQNLIWAFKVSLCPVARRCGVGMFLIRRQNFGWVLTSPTMGKTCCIFWRPL